MRLVGKASSETKNHHVFMKITIMMYFRNNAEFVLKSQIVLKMACAHSVASSFRFAPIFQTFGDLLAAHDILRVADTGPDTGHLVGMDFGDWALFRAWPFGGLPVGGDPGDTAVLAAT
jgi:hypothetical protein